MTYKEEDIIASIKQLCHQRDELIEALRLAMRWVEFGGPYQSTRGKFIESANELLRAIGKR